MSSEPSPILLSTKPVGSAIGQNVLLYRIPSELQGTKKFKQATRGIKPIFINRFLNRTASPLERPDWQSALQTSRMELFSRIDPQDVDALRLKNLRLLIEPSIGAFDGQAVVEVLPSQIRDRIVLPRDKEKACEYIPAAEKESELAPALHGLGRSPKGARSHRPKSYRVRDRDHNGVKSSHPSNHVVSEQLEPYRRPRSPHSSHMVPHAR